MKKIGSYLIMSLMTMSMTLAQQSVQPGLGKRTVTLLRDQSLNFKDLNKNNKLDPYEDWRLPVETRVNDLLPTGKLPFTIPSSEKAVADNKSDVAGHSEGKGYALFKFGTGLSY